MVSAAECINTGSCMVLSKNAYYATIGIYIMFGILLVLFLFTAFWTPGVIFLRAKLQKRHLIYIINRSQGGRFAIGKVKSEGITDVKGSGPYMLTENSHTIEKKSNLPLFFAFGEFAATLPLKWVYAVNKIREIHSRRGDEITNIEDLGAKVGRKYDEVNKVWVSDNV